MFLRVTVATKNDIIWMTKILVGCSDAEIFFSNQFDIWWSIFCLFQIYDQQQASSSILSLEKKLKDITDTNENQEESIIGKHRRFNAKDFKNKFEKTFSHLQLVRWCIFLVFVWIKELPWIEVFSLQFYVIDYQKEEPSTYHC